jgi:M6 family metalloprotease-like protein
MKIKKWYRAMLGACALVLPLSGLCVDAAADPLAACRLPERGIRSDVGLGFPRKPHRLKTSGDLRFTVLFVDFSDVPAAVTPRQALDVISPNAEAFFRAVSYGKLNLSFAPHERWIRMARPSAAYGMRRGASFATHRAYLQEAVRLAGDGVDYSASDAILVLTPPNVSAIDYGPAFTASPAWGIQAGGREFLNGATSGSDLAGWGWTWFVHEAGHTLSLVDLYGNVAGSPLWNTHVGEFSAMGATNGRGMEYLGWERWQLGWIEDRQVVCATPETRQVRLTPIERPGGAKILVLPLGPGKAMVFESRRAEGYDRRLPRPGVLAYSVDTSLSSQQGAIRVLPVNDRDDHHLDAPMQPGSTMRVPGYSITVGASDADGDTLDISASN